MAPAYRIAPFGAAHPAPGTALAALQTALLPASPLALLGPHFLEQFYYRRLPGADLIFGAVAYVDDRPAGFIVATTDGDGFMGAAIRRWWWRLAWVMTTAVLRDPRRLAAVWEALQIMRTRDAPTGAEHTAELLTFGVLEEFRSMQFIRETGLHIAADLFNHAHGALRDRNVPAVRAIVDADNTAVKLFYRSRGWTLARSAVPGWRVPSVEFVWRADGQRADALSR